MGDKKETKIVSRKIGEKPETRIVHRDFSKPSREQIQNDINALRKEIQNTDATAGAKIQKLFDKGEITQQQYDACVDAIIECYEHCKNLIDMLECFKFETLIQYEYKKKTIETSISLLKAELRKTINSELGKEFTNDLLV